MDHLELTSEYPRINVSISIILFLTLLQTVTIPTLLEMEHLKPVIFVHKIFSNNIAGFAIPCMIPTFFQAHVSTCVSAMHNTVHAWIDAYSSYMFHTWNAHETGAFHA